MATRDPARISRSWARLCVVCGALALAACGARSELSPPEATPRLAKDCTAPEAIVLAREDRGFYNLALDETHVYWAADGAVRRVSKCGGTPETLVEHVPTVFDL